MVVILIKTLSRNTLDTCSLSLSNWDRWFSFSMRLLCSENSWTEMYFRLLSCFVFRSLMIVSWLEIFCWSSIIFCVETGANILIKTIRKAGDRKGKLCHRRSSQRENSRVKIRNFLCKFYGFFLQSWASWQEFAFGILLPDICWGFQEILPYCSPWWWTVAVSFSSNHLLI